MNGEKYNSRFIIKSPIGSIALSCNYKKSNTSNYYRISFRFDDIFDECRRIIDIYDAGCIKYMLCINNKLFNIHLNYDECDLYVDIPNDGIYNTIMFGREFWNRCCENKKLSKENIIQSYKKYLEPCTIENFKKDNRLGDFFVSDSQKEIEKMKLEIKLTELKLELLKRGE